MLRRADYVRERKLLRDSHVHSHETQSVHKLGWETGWAHSLLSLAFATRWNQKHPSSPISQLCCGEQTIRDV